LSVIVKLKNIIECIAMLIVLLYLFLGSLIVADTAHAENMMQTPFGPFPEQCVHQHPNGSHVKEVNGTTRVSHENGYEKIIESNDLCKEHADKILSQSPAGALSGKSTKYISNGYFNMVNWVPPTSRPVGDFTAVYTVPSPPEAGQDGQFLYYFIGAQDSPVTTVLQPVLTWSEVMTGSTGWGLASWNCCPSHQIHHTSYLTGIQEGDTITGKIKKIKGYQSTYTVTGETDGRTVVLSVDLGPNRSLNGIMDVSLEAYRVTKCSQFSSGPAKFSNISISDVSATKMIPGWTLFPPPYGKTDCDGRITPGTNEITIQQNIKQD
jgi:hypothetical protein